MHSIEKPRVSIVIPLFNKANYICRALDSIFAQTFNDYEILIINDGSTDDSVLRVQAYKDRRIRLIHQKNSGPGAARNRGIEEARGEFVAFLDADDEWLPEYIEKSCEILEKNPTCAVCTSAWYQDHAKGFDQIYERRNILDVYMSCGVEIEAGQARAACRSSNENLLMMWFTGTTFIRKEILANFRFYGDTRHTYGEDHFLWIQLAFNFDFYRNTEPLAWYHNDASELAYGGYRKRPLEAFLLWPEKLMANTAGDRRRMLKKWMLNYAIRAAHNRLGVGQIDNAVWLIKKFPSMSYNSPKLFLMLGIKIILYHFKLYKPCQ